MNIKTDRLEKKNKGQFYTPKEIINYMISYLDIGSNKRIIEPACGRGSFLLSIIENIKKKESNYNFNNLYGIDINKNSVNITKTSLILKAGFKKEYIEIFNKNIITGNSIVENKQIDPLAINWEKTFHKVIKDGGFDIVIGNPPYVTLKKGKDFDPNESVYKDIIKGKANAATLMIGQGLKYLKNGGILAFILPKSMLHVNSYSRLRNYILDNTTILHIVDLGLKFKDVRGEQIILFLKKEKPSSEHLIETKILKNSKEDLKQQPSNFVKQSTFKTFNNKILFFDNKMCYSLLKKIHSNPASIKLYNLVDGQIFRGLPLNNRISANPIAEPNERIISGKSIAKFSINNIEYVNKKDVETSNKNLVRKLKNKKIVMQNIFSPESGIIATYDKERLLTLDTVTNIIIQDDILAKYLLGLLHSKLINFYVGFALFNRSRLTMHLDRSYIGEIPIVDIQNINRYNLIKLVDNAIIKKRNTKELLRSIDKEVYKIYDLTDEEIKLIEMEMDKSLSQKSRW